MDKINQKLNKYRLKLINANTSEKMDFYNLKMQQYLIMQKQLLKSGGGMEIFAMVSDTKKNEVYSIDNPEKNEIPTPNIEDIEKNLTVIKNRLDQVSENYNNNNSEIAKSLIDIRREAMKSIDSPNLIESPTFKNIDEAITGFKCIEKVLVKYYIDEIKSLDDNDEKIDYILSELTLFETNTIKEIFDNLHDVKIPEKIMAFFREKGLQSNDSIEVQTGGLIENVNNNEIKIEDRINKIYKKYF